MSCASRIAAATAALALLSAPGIFIPNASAEPGPADLVDALNEAFGKYPHKRAAHPKGVCVTGVFTPSKEAPGLSKAPQFSKPVPVIGRFSLAGGNPEAPDNDKGNPKGLALRFDLGDGASTDLVTISAPVFVANTPQAFLDLLTAVTSGDAGKVKAFFDAHPESKNQGTWLNARPLPASYAGVNYWGVHAFTLTNADGEETVAKFKLLPSSGEITLTDAEAEAKGPNFLADEITARLAKDPARFDVVAIIGQEGDPTDDATALWDEDNREKVSLGEVSIEAIAPEATCDAFSFLPANVADGVAGPSNDPIFAIRSPAYIVSFTRRVAP